MQINYYRWQGAKINTTIAVKMVSIETDRDKGEVDEDEEGRMDH